jgi:hypothetical protein
MRFLTIPILVFILSSTSCYRSTVDEEYLNLLTSRLEQAGQNIDTLIYNCEQRMIDGKYFKDRASHNYIDFIKQVNNLGDVSTDDWRIDQVTSEALLSLDISYNLDSQMTFRDVLDTNSIAYKGVCIFDEVSSQADLSPTIITSSVLKYIEEDDFDNPLYRLLFFKFLSRLHDPDIDRGLRVKLPPYSEKDVSDIPIDSNFIIEINVTSSDTILVNRLPIELNRLTDRVKSFLKTVPEDSINSQSHTSRKIVSLKNQRGTSLERYVAVYNELIRAYNEVRNEAALERYKKVYKDLDKTQQKDIKSDFPMRISESEPVEYYDD